MSIDSVTQKHLSALEKKLQNAISSRADLEKDLSSQSSVFIKFINKLSHACKGMDLELDNKLATLRSMSQGSQPFIAISNQMNIISELLKKQAQKNEKNIQLMQENLISSGKNLQKSKGMPGDTRRKLRNFIEQNSDAKQTIIQYIPALNELLALYDEALAKGITTENSTEAENINQESSPAGIHETQTQEFIEQLKESVRLATEHIKLSALYQKKLSIAKNKVKASESKHHFILALEDIFSIISQDLQQERETAQSFLSSLSETLSNVQKAVLSTISTSKDVKEQNTKLNNQLNSELAYISQEIAKADSLDTIKHDINLKLNAIVDLLAEKTKFEESSERLIAEKLIDMTERVKNLEEESMKFQTRLQEQLVKSMQDALTKLNNRAAFDDFFSKAIVKYHHKPFPLSIAIVDIDDFKKINDTYGHIAGDKTLQVIANTIKKLLTKENVFISRYGGEEFVLIFSSNLEKQLIACLNNLREKIASLPFSFKNNKVSISISVGCTHIRADDNIHQAFERADNALYKAKHQGKNQVIYS